MRAVLQRVTEADVSVDGSIVGRVDGPGLVVLLAVTHGDGPTEVAWMARKIADLRIMRDERSVLEIGGTVLMISQFTLYGDARKGRRPTWQAAAPPAVSLPLYDDVCATLAGLGVPVERGVFGADMAVRLVNDGPTTLVLESPSA